MRKIDLHLHTAASDGIYLPSQLISIVSEHGLSAVAITDHETTDGVEEAVKAGSKLGVEVIAGVEISAGFHGREIHLLGYMPSYETGLEDTLIFLREGRFKRMEKIIEILNKMGINVTVEDIKEESGKAAPGRLHIARYLYKHGYVSDIKQAFDLYLGRNKPAYIPRIRLKASEAIKILDESGAIPVLAHPGLTNESDRSLYELKKEGLRGIEVYHPEHTEGLTLFYKNWALKEGLLITGGSDFHGDAKESCPYPGCISVDYSCLESIKERWK